MLVMLATATPVRHFINRHPTLKILALRFLLLLFVMLMAEGFGKHMERGDISFAMGFSLFVELLNRRLRAVSEPVRLKPDALNAAKFRQVRKNGSALGRRHAGQFDGRLGDETGG